MLTCAPLAPKKIPLHLLAFLGLPGEEFNRHLAETVAKLVAD